MAYSSLRGFDSFNSKKFPLDHRNESNVTIRVLPTQRRYNISVCFILTSLYYGHSTTRSPKHHKRVVSRISLTLWRWRWRIRSRLQVVFFLVILRNSSNPIADCLQIKYAAELPEEALQTTAGEFPKKARTGGREGKNPVTTNRPKALEAEKCEKQRYIGQSRSLLSS